MTVTRGLIIADPWIGHILDGRKDWEMRAQATSVRGWFGLIRKGSGTVVGLARLVDCGRALDRDEMIASIDHHRKRTAHLRSSSAGTLAVDWTSVATVQIYSFALGCCASARSWMIPKVALGTTLGADFALFEWSS